MALVSVILPTYSRNASGMLRTAITTVLAQDFEDLELFVVDDGSVDGSAETIKSFADADSRVRHVRFDRNIGLPALTAADAWASSRGQYLAWQFDDCSWTPRHLTTLLEGFRRNPRAGVVYGQAVMKTAGDDYVLGDFFDADRLRTANFIPNCSTLIARHVIETIGWFDPSVLLKRICDYDFWCRASDQFAFEFCKQVVAIEHGLALSDSLGNSVSLLTDLTAKYRARSRNESLKVEKRSSWNPFAVPDWMDEGDKETFAFVVFEHFVRIRQAAAGAQVLADLLPHRFPRNGHGNGQDDTALLSAVFYWYLEATGKFRNALQLEMLAMQRYIDRQDQQIQNRLRAAVVKRLPENVVGWIRDR